MGYDNNYLYIAADVCDDKLMQNFHGQDIWKGDHVMVALQYPYTPLRESKNVWCFVFSPGNFDDIKPQVYIFDPVTADPAGIRTASRRTDKGYSLEAAIPWKLLGKAPKRFDRLRFDLMLSDSDSEFQEAILSTSPIRRKGRPWHIARQLEGVFAKADGTFPSTALAQEYLMKTPEHRLNANNKNLKVVIPAALTAKARTLKVAAVLDYKVFAGGQPAMYITVNGKRMMAQDCISRDGRIQFGNHDMATCTNDGRWFTTYGNLAGKGYVDFHSSGVKIHPCEYEFELKDKLIAGKDNIVEIERVTNRQEDLICQISVSEYETKPLRSTLKAAPTGELDTVEPDIPSQVDFSWRMGNDGAVYVTAGGVERKMVSSYSTQTPDWARFGGAGEGYRERIGNQVTLKTREFEVVRTIEKLADRIIVRDKLINLTDNILPLMYKHEIDFAGLARAYVAGYPRRSESGVNNLPPHPAVAALNTTGGVVMLAGDDITQVLSTEYSHGNLIGMKNERLVLTPKRTLDIAIELYVLEKPDYWYFINRARQAWNVNFTLPGAGAFMNGRRLPDLPKLKSQLNAYSAKIAILSGIYGNLNGQYAAFHGLSFAEQDFSCYKDNMEKLRQAKPGIKVLPYFHSFISNGKNDKERFADDRLIDSNGNHADYSTGNYPLYVPYPGSKFAAAQEELLEKRWQMGFDAIYWDETEYSRLFYSFSDKYWDNTTAVISPKTHRMVRKISSVPLLTEDWRVPVAEKLIKRGKGLLIGNGAPFTKRMRDLHTVRFIETGSITNLILGQLYTPLALGDHLTVRTPLDAYKDMLRALDFGCVYYYYSPTFGNYPTLTEYMFPITPMRMGNGFIIGKERIITNCSGLFGWGDQSNFEVHIFDRSGKEDPKYSVPVVERNGKRYAEIRIPGGYSAAIIRK